MKPFLLLLFLISAPASAQKLLIPMDLSQTDHLKAYGVAYWILERGDNIEWLLNYRGGAFLVNASDAIERECRLRGVTVEKAGGAAVGQMYGIIETSNMEVVLLEKAPNLAIYSPPNAQPWDDAVTMAVEYAEIPYTKIWDEEVLNGQLEEFDWLHLHHEDFTGQYGKFYANYGRTQWYMEQQILSESMAKRLGYSKVSDEKKTVAQWIQEFVLKGGFLFAMCSATDTYDIALAAARTDITAAVFDGDPADPDCQERLDFSRTFAFENFTLEMNPLVYEYSNIDIPSSHQPVLRGADADYFSLFEFSAKYDPVPSMLTQNHVAVIKGYMGQTTAFRKSLLKKPVIILGEVEESEMVKYIHGNAGKGTFTFLGGHDPEDYTHNVGDPPTNLALHKNSPGYRLILNNILFPAAKKKERKT